MGKATVVPTEMWASALPAWAYFLVGFCPDTGGVELETFGAGS